ncbi:alpha/beta fold hydrolase [Corynebacterium choanae]|uniref:Proline iminopeptidase n=1 Tax=Corynebacterium choanae TaxID=1862358 RepID=A0A3G6JBP6_9CORY|nr:Proline iminopeptidase [Corynebacterium choanae]
MGGYTYKPHTITRPRVVGKPEYGEITVFAREVIPPGGEEFPMIIKLQGGPGCPSPRPVAIGSWLALLLKRYRLLLLDQRGTGYSTPLDQHSPELATYSDEQLAEVLAGLRADAIVDDCEAFREYFGLDQVSLVGQSYGGFCATTYMSKYPDKLDKVYLTGGLPATDCGIDDVYRATYAALAARHEQFFAQFPFAEQAIRQLSQYLDENDVRLPNGVRLTSRMFRTVGINLGRDTGFATLAYLLEAPFHHHGDSRPQLRDAWLSAVAAQVSFASTPLYAALHESIYGGTVPGATRWSAQRLRAEIPGFAEDADPLDESQPFYLTGEHIYPWMFEEDPALQPFAGAVAILAEKDDWESLYDREAMATTTATGAAAVYVDDIFVPMQYSLSTAAAMRDMRPWITNAHQHDGIAGNGEAILSRLIDMVDDH